MGIHESSKALFTRAMMLKSTVPRDGDGDGMIYDGTQMERKDPQQSNDRAVKFGKRFFNSDSHAEKFAKWFSGSRVTDADGDPLVVYHGAQSPDEFEEFDMSRAGQNYDNKPGDDSGYAHFTDSPAVAFMYAGVPEQDVGLELGNRDDKTFVPGNIYDDGQLSGMQSRSIKAKNSDGRVYPVFLNIKNPLIIDDQIAQFGDIPEFISEAKRNGNDGLILRDRNWHSAHANGGDEYVVFDNSQIFSTQLRD